MVNRWTLRDPSTNETWRFPMNPNAMATPHDARNLRIFVNPPAHDPALNRRGAMGRVFEAPADPYEWTFSGSIREQEHYEQLDYWCRKVNRIRLTDHFGRTWSIRMVAFNPTEQRPTARRPWRFAYEVRALMYGQV